MQSLYTFGTTWCILPEGNSMYSITSNIITGFFFFFFFSSNLINQPYENIFLAHFESYFLLVMEKQGIRYVLE